MAGASKRGNSRKGPLVQATSRDRGHLGRGALVSLLLHLHLLVPLVVATFIYAKREEAQRAEEVDVGFENVPPEQLPEQLPPLDDTPPPIAKLGRDRVKPDRREKLEEKKKKREEKVKPEQKVAEQKPTPPEPEVVVPPLPPMPKPEPKPQPPPPKDHEKMVDLDNGKDVEPPPDAKFLAQKNNRAEVETRATQTNLEHEQKGGEGSQETQGQRQDDKEVGDDKAKVADLEDVKSKQGREAPAVTPHERPEEQPSVEPPTPRRTSPVLTLRDAAPRGHDLTPETVDPSLPRDPTGLLARPTPHGAMRDDDGPRPSKGQRVKLALSAKDYEYMFGAEAKADRQFAQKEKSTRLGRHAQRLARVTSALENFIPEVRPGNQTALNTRAAPFAAFIARMHRSIHRLWGYGALEDWDELPSSSPFNDETLLATLEIVLNRDGTVDKVTPVRRSKYLPYDAAAIDVVYSAGPYPDPPREIRSGNGKIYIHWNFYRDGRACATSGVDYFILANAPAGGDGGGGDEDPAVPASSTPSARPSAGGGPRAGAGAGSAAGARGAGGEPEPAEAEGRPAPRRLERNLNDGSPGARAARRVAAEMAPDPDASGASLPSPAGPRSEDTGAVRLAREWFAAFVHGDVDAMVRRSGFPFRSAAGVAAQSASDLTRMLSALVAETPSRTEAPVSVETGAGLRKLIGKLPTGLDDGSGLLFAVTHADGGDTLILLLARSAGAGAKTGWRAVGLIRR